MPCTWERRHSRVGAPSCQRGWGSHGWDAAPSKVPVKTDSGVTCRGEGWHKSLRCRSETVARVQSCFKQNPELAACSSWERA